MPAFSADSGKGASSLPRGAELIGIATAGSNDHGIDHRLKKDLDSLVSLIKQLSVDTTILIEAYSPGKRTKVREEQIKNSFALGENVEQYLRIQHKLENNFIIAIWQDKEENGNMPKVRLTTYPRDFFEN
jgi:hypothetical protein